MRKIIAFLLLLSSGQIFSQDVIIKRNGEELKAKVVELTETTVKYKPEDNLDGPIYNIPKSEVFKIKYATGKSDFLGNVEPTEKKVDAPPTEKKVIEPVTVAPSQSKYDSLMKVGKSNKTWGTVGCILGPVFIVSGSAWIALGALETNPTLQTIDFACGGVILACGVAELIVGPISLTKGKKQIAAAQQYKGQVYMSLPSLRLSNFSSRAGVGIGTTITF